MQLWVIFFLYQQCFSLFTFAIWEQGGSGISYRPCHYSHGALGCCGCPYDACTLRQSEPTPGYSKWCLQVNQMNENSLIFLIHKVTLLITQKVVFDICVIVIPYKTWCLLKMINLNLFVEWLIDKSLIYHYDWSLINMTSDCCNKPCHCTINIWYIRVRVKHVSLSQCINE